MVHSTGVQLIWQFAAFEAISANFKVIEPFHVVNALLKFAEFDEEKLTEVIHDKTVIHDILSERDLLRAFLAGRGIEQPQATKKIRRALRNKMGDGGFGEKNRKEIHRSEQTKTIFRNAEELARKDTPGRLTVLSLATELLDHQIVIPKDLLAEAGVTTDNAAKQTPLLDTYGKNLSSSEGRVPAVSPEDIRKIQNDPVIKVLADTLKNHKKEPILLIQGGARSGQEIMCTLATLMNARSAADVMPEVKIIEVDLKNICGREGDKKNVSLKEQIHALLNEASEKKNIILYCPGFEDWFDPKQKILFLMLMEYLKNRSFWCVCSIKETSYREHSGTSPEISRIFRPVWIHDIDSSFSFI